MNYLKNDVVNVVHIAVSWRCKMTSLVNKSQTPNAKFPPITALLNRSTYHKSAKVLSPNFMGTPNQWISWL